MNFVRLHLGALGLTRADLKTFRFRQDYVDAIGVHNLSWTQSVDGTTVFGNGLLVRVTRDGRVLSVQGSPVSGLASLAAAAPTSASVSAESARTTAARNVGGALAPAKVTVSRTGTSAATVWSNRDQAQRVWFLTPQGLRPGWSTYVQTSAGAYQHVIDAATGTVLYRHANTDDANGDAKVYDNYPGAAKGGKPKVVNFYHRGWLKRGASFLKGSSVTAYMDLNDDDAIQKREKTPVPGTKSGAQFPLKKFGPKASGFCRQWVCTWNPKVKRSWRTNRFEATTNGFYFASNFHDYLAKPPISFTKAAGNFSASGHDPVRLNTLDGADTDHGMPDGNHIDNANMATPPDGISPIMQMYLFHAPGVPDRFEPFVPTTGSLDASVQYHEYTHGLSNRLVVDPSGNSTLNDIQAGSMGEAWSDYYAMDYLVTKGFLKNTKKSGELLEGKYVAANQPLIRTMAIDCAVGAKKPRHCHSGFDPRIRGGYVYGQFPKIVGGAEVHGSGEIWGQTLWDLRTKLGHRVADAVITRGMTMSAEDPDFLDMRNGILRADLVQFGGKHQKAIWKVFAHRGMGFFAGSLNSADATPKNDFHVPPKPSTKRNGVIAGHVTDPFTGDPVVGIQVSVAGQGTNFRTVTDADGHYRITHLVLGRYAKVIATGPGYLDDSSAVKAIPKSNFDPSTDSTDFGVTRDWAAISGGAKVTAFEGPNFADFGCSPNEGFDTSLTTGWGSVSLDEDGTPDNVFDPKSVTVRLAQPVDVTHFQVDPDATCGDDPSSAVADFEIETSTNGTTWHTVASSTFDESNLGKFNQVDPSGFDTNVSFVRFTIVSNQTPNFGTTCPDSPLSGCVFTDLTELAVLGSPAG